MYVELSHSRTRDAYRKQVNKGLVTRQSLIFVNIIKQNLML